MDCCCLAWTFLTHFQPYISKMWNSMILVENIIIIIKNCQTLHWVYYSYLIMLKCFFLSYFVYGQMSLTHWWMIATMATSQIFKTKTLVGGDSKMNPLMLWTCSILVNHALLGCKWKVGHIWIFLMFLHNFKMPTCLRKLNTHDGLQNICMFQI